MAKKFDVVKFNTILEDYNQQLRAEQITGKEIVLSNGLVLTSAKEVRLCKNRIMTGHSVWKENFDKVYSLDVTERQIAEKECRAKTSSTGGVSCQRQHGDKIRRNLNTGTPWNKGMTGTYPYAKVCTEETKKLISLANTGNRNGMFGKKMTAKEKQRRSTTMREAILTGKFTPNSNNRNTHWDSCYKGKKYRSSWEALYQYFDAEAEYETVRVPYSYNNKEHVYIIDFVNHNTKMLIEVKPKELTTDAKTQAKIEAAQKWCSNNNYRFVLVDKEYLLARSCPDSLDDFDAKTQIKIRKLYEIN